MPYLDGVIWVQADLLEARRRCIDREGSDEAAVSFWHEWMAQELPFLARQRPWEWADLFVAGTPECPHDSATSVLTTAPAPGDAEAHVS
jgi:hypothetical protein